jgi:hypothetical protein
VGLNSSQEEADWYPHHFACFEYEQSIQG